MQNHVGTLSGFSELYGNAPLASMDKSKGQATLADSVLALKGVHDTGIIYVSSDGSSEHTSYDEFYYQAMTMLALLNDQGVKAGQYLMIDLQEKKAFFTVFNACLLGGIIPAPITEQSQYADDNPEFQKTRNVFFELGCPAFMTDQKKIDRYWLSDAFSDHRQSFIAYETSPLKRSAQPATVRNRDICLIQYSSGSTGSPKGVQLSHNNLLVNIQDMASALNFSRDDVGLSWMPHTHDMGLIGQHIAYIVHQSNQIHISPSTFIRKPNLLFKLIEQYKVTVTGMPNFALVWLLNNIDMARYNSDTLASLRVIINGAEPISTKVLRKFQRKFGSLGLQSEAMTPCYGLAEASVGVTFSKHDEPFNALRVSRRDYVTQQGITTLPEDSSESDSNLMEVVCVGYPLANTRLRITNDQNIEVNHGSIGEIQISGANVARGYIGGTETDQDASNAWFSTGDLGFIYQRQLFVCGRKKDLAIINGKNYFCADLELSLLENCPQLKEGEAVVTSITEGGGENILLFLKTKKTDANFVDRAIAAKRSLEDIIQTKIFAIIPVKYIPKTSSGKVRRYKMRENFLKGLYSIAVERLQSMMDDSGPIRLQQLPLTHNEQLVRSIWSKLLDRDPSTLNITDNFFDLGGTSIIAVKLLYDIEHATGVDYGHDLLIENRTIGEMASSMERFDHSLANSPKATQCSVKSREAEISGEFIAITGIGVRMPGAHDATSLWHSFEQGQTSIMPVDRKMNARFQHLNNLPCSLGALTDSISFDYHGDKFKHDELEWIDPHQKLLLNCTEDALRDSGHSINAGSNTGIYFGAGQSGFLDTVMTRISSGLSIPPSALVGSLLNSYAARISHLYDFKGPSMVFDTACSSSITALHYAIADISANKVDSALVGGANLVLGPTQIDLFTASGVMSASGRCSVFSKNADGVVIGEGGAVIHLETLASARKHDRKVYGVIRKCALNNNGATLGIMAPRPEGQIDVINKAFHESNIQKKSIAYFEVHGTGTAIGDPVEINSLKRAFSDVTTRDNPIYLGSSKSNFGHLLAASGMVGLLRAVLSLHHKRIPPCINIDQINPALKLEDTCFAIPEQALPWESGGPRRACVNSFGFGGTNGHVILEEHHQ